MVTQPKMNDETIKNMLFTLMLQGVIISAMLGYMCGMLSSIHKRLSQILARYCVKNGFKAPEA